MDANNIILSLAAVLEGCLPVELAGKRQNDVDFSKSQELKMIIKWKSSKTIGFLCKNWKMDHQEEIRTLKETSGQITKVRRSDIIYTKYCIY